MAEGEVPNPEELEEKRDKTFSRRVAFTTAVYAVVLAISGALCTVNGFLLLVRVPFLHGH